MKKMTERIKVCHVVDRFDIGGMENGIVNLSNLFDRSLFLPSVVCLRSSGTMAKRLKADVNIHCMHYQDGKGLFRPIFFARYLKKEKIDIIHTHAWGGGSFTGILGAKIAKVPVVINGEHGSFFTKKSQVFVQRILFKLCDANLAVSESLKNNVNKILSVPLDKITVIKNGVDSQIFSGNYPKKKILKSLSSNYGCDFGDNPFIVISAGSLKSEKGQILLLKAARKLIAEERITRLKVIFAGDGPDKNKLSAFVDQNKLNSNIYFLGNRSDMPELLSIADLLVSTSVGYHEGLSNVMLEAMSSSVPVVATMSVGAKEVVKNGYNGFLLKKPDDIELSMLLRSIIKNRQLLQKISINAKTTVQSHFTIETMVRNYQDLYLKLLKEKINHFASS